MRTYTIFLKLAASLALSFFVLSVAYADSAIKRRLDLGLDINPAAENTLLLPSDVAVSNSYIYVVDGGHHRVVVFDQQGNYAFSFGSYGAGKGEFNSPVGIDVSEGGEVYVADTANKRIQVFSAAGKFVRLFKVKSGRYIIRPIDVLVDEKAREVYVSGNDNHKVMVFSSKGKLKREWGGNGTSEGEFRYPATLAHLKDGRVAVVDVLNARLQIFEKNGDYSIQISGWGVEPGQVFRPKGVAVDKDGDIYISDSYLNLVQVFSDVGKLKYILDTVAPRTLYTPVGMYVDAKNKLYITEMRKHRISVFSLNP